MGSKEGGLDPNYEIDVDLHNISIVIENLDRQSATIAI